MPVDWPSIAVGDYDKQIGDKVHHVYHVKQCYITRTSDRHNLLGQWKLFFGKGGVILLLRGELHKSSVRAFHLFLRGSGYHIPIPNLPLIATYQCSIKQKAKIVIMDQYCVDWLPALRKMVIQYDFTKLKHILHNKRPFSCGYYSFISIFFRIGDLPRTCPARNSQCKILSDIVR